jgi:iron-sulfur cluster repair protein YtfE (RIC family)
MTMASDAPADTTMMRIVHDAYRRDLARATTVLTDPETRAEQRRAIGRHLARMMQALHAHHTSEDEGLYPLARERARTDGDALQVLDRMSAEHEGVAVALGALAAAGETLATEGSEEAAGAALAALGTLSAALLPHLREEEDLAMPIVSRLLTAAEWAAIENKHNLDSKSMSELGFEGHWLIDGAAEKDRRTVIELVPPLPRLILLRGFAGRYRRHAEACWNPRAKVPRLVQRENRVAVVVEADIDEVWDVVRSVTRVGEWSHECVDAQWLGDATAAVPGARFRGRNRAGVFRWGRICEIVSASPYELVCGTVPTALFPDSSEWRITLRDVDGRTEIAQEFHVLRGPKLLSMVYARLIPAHVDRTEALREDLRRLGAAAARSRSSAAG